MKSSILLKSIAYILLFIFLVLSAYSLMCYVFYREIPEITSDKNYYETENFSTLYSAQISHNVRLLQYRIRDQEEEQKLAIQQENGEYRNSSLLPSEESTSTNNGLVRNEIEYTGLNAGMDSNFKFLIIYNGFMVTNVEKTANTDTIEEIIQTILEKDQYWTLENGEVSTNIINLEKDKVLYSGYLENVFQEEYTIYTSLDTQNIKYNSFDRNKALYDILQQVYIGYEMLPIYAFLAIVIFLYLTTSMGHRKEQKGICLNFIDKIPFEIIGIVLIVGIVLECICLSFIFIDLTNDIIYDKQIMPVVSILSMIAIIYITIMVLYATIIRRIKSRTLIKNSICYRIYAGIKKLIVKSIKQITSHLRTSWKIAILYGGFLFISVLLCAFAMDNFFGLLLIMTFWIWVFTKIIQFSIQNNKIKNMIKDIYEGKTDTKLEEGEFNGEFNQIANQLNDIAGGFSNAIEENLKSERMKTELITNVSHDLKTPLTSIINYVDLLKQEEIPNEKAREYIEILDNKSQRLKKLTEDLVEASKASSGALKLNMEKLNVKELINQVTGEFEDKFKEKGLKVIVNHPSQEVLILADSRYMYRVIENMYSNIAKYALEDSRVYVDIVKNENKVLIAIKNISKQQLNITPQELMQRFVRGDVSRNTEGSGLGLSIAESLTQLQQGEFNIYLDGDLFKVVIVFNAIE